MKRRTVALALVPGILLTGCATSDDDAWSEPLAHRAFPAGHSVAFAPETLTSTLPSTTYVGDVGADEFHYSQTVVTGRFISSENGPAIDWSSDQGKEVAWSSDHADSRDLELTLKVDSIVDQLESADVEPGDEVTVWITVAGDDAADEIAAGLLGIDETLVFLTRHPEGLYDGGWTVALGGALVGVVDPQDGGFELPVLDAASSLGDTGGSSMVRDAASVDDLISAGEGQTEVVVE